MKQFTFLLVITVFLAGCGETSKTQETKTLTSGITLSDMDTTVRPGKDFARFVNGGWIDNTEIPSGRSRYGAFTILHEQSQEQVRTIIEESAAGDFEVGTDEQKVGDLYNSYQDTTARDALGVNPLLPDFEKIDAIASADEIDDYIVYAIEMGFSPPLNFWINNNADDPTKYSLYMTQDGLGLPDREFYFNDNEKSEETRQEYVAHIGKMFELAGQPEVASKAQAIMDFETKLAEIHWRKEDNRDRIKTYNFLSVDSLTEASGNIDWNTFFTNLGAGSEDSVVIRQPSYITALDEMVGAESLDNWKLYFKWVALNYAANKLSMDLDRQNFYFYATHLRGIPEPQPMWRRAVNVVNAGLGEVVGKVYVAKHFPPEAKARMDELVGNLIKAYEVSINELDWMGTETKMQALDKLSKFRPKIGYPNKWKDYSDVDIVADNYFANNRSMMKSVHNREMAKLGSPINKEEWFMSPQTVNAYYNPAMNEIVFPAAILRPPFFNMDADDAVNYGGIGAVIGHEIGHGFDDQGSRTDGDGILRNWWTDKDREEFEKRTGKLIAQYDGFEVLPGVNVNGMFTLGENIGDLGGLSIALKAYQMSLEGKEAPMMDGYTGVQRVFLGYGQVFRSKAREQALRTQVQTDPHSPDEFRINGIVRNVPQFYNVFGVSESDSLFLAPEERVKIW